MGQTSVDLSLRMSRHWEDADSGSDSPLHRAMRKYGIDAFEINQLDMVSCSKSFADGKTQNEANRLENLYIEKHQTHLKHGKGGHNRRMNCVR